ncbi:hypothetical protein V5799_016065 [Amblyomma americanum]|uniref:Uncharacterized protein n=1 Tax=Amblyomma americanum TaxID=6943 RepID=A0AAQ4F788_AMBAM
MLVWLGMAAGLPEAHELPVSEESDDSTESFPEEGTRRRSSGSSSEMLRRKYRQLKHRYEQRTESLLQMLGDLNTKYLELRPAYESTQERLRHLERELSEARAEIEKQERWHSEMYLKMYRLFAIEVEAGLWKD